MKLIINGNDYHYAFEQLIRVFEPDIQLTKLFESPLPLEGDFIACETKCAENAVSVRVQICLSGTEKVFEDIVSGENLFKAGELQACKRLFSVLKDIYHYTPQWGMQTGVRPTKIYFNLLRNNTPKQAIQYLKDDLFISENKVSLVQQVCENERAIIESAQDDEFSLYVSIPFCPSRCSYCSFISHAYQSIKKLIPAYVNKLCEEIAEISRVTASLGLKLRTVYIGGGTPSVLEPEQLESIFKTIQTAFDCTGVTEFTLEAGRPDTLDAQKLALIARSPVTRLTINAQSFNDSVLQYIGRNHTAQDVKDAYALARQTGFENINTDLIAGLEGESIESFLHSVREAIALQAQNITIHTLALKRSSFLITRDNTKGQIVSQTSVMIDEASAILRENGYFPYYMYRQSKSVGNLENTGWAKPGFECEYNIFMMEEVQHVFGAGAGAVTRLVNRADGDIKRIYNYKYPYEYIDDFAQMIERKNTAREVIEKWRKP